MARPNVPMQMTEAARRGAAGELDTRRLGQKMKPGEAGALGWESGAQVDPANQMQFEGLETHNKIQPLQRWEDLSETSVRGSKTRSQISEGMQSDFGVSHRSMRRAAGASLDRAKQDAMDEARRQGATGVEALGAQPQGRDFYVEGRNRIAERGRQFGLYDSPRDEARPHLDVPKGAGTDVETASGMVAAMSPRVAWQQQVAGREMEHTNIDVAEEVAFQESNPTGNPLSVSTGLPASAEKAARIYAGEKPENVLGGKKVESFYQNFTQPHHPEGRSTVDTHMVNALTGLEEEQGLKMLSRKGGYESIDRAIREAGSERGLAPEEGQSEIWHQQKRETERGGSHVHGFARRKMEQQSRDQIRMDFE